MPESELHSALNLFPPMSLSEAENVALMNRYDSKYVFSARKLSALLSLLYGSFYIVEISQDRAFRYNTIYLDTPDYLFYNQHINGKLQRHKVRFRKYESTGMTFLEVKCKTNKLQTIKWRIENDSDPNSPDNNAVTFIKKYIPSVDLNLAPVIVNGFMRITLVSNNFKDRITFDYDIDFSNLHGEKISLPFIAIAELKSENISSRSPFLQAAKQAGIRPVSFSKYCIGSSLLLDVPKKNLLKPRLLLLKKLENEYSEFNVT